MNHNKILFIHLEEFLDAYKRVLFYYFFCALGMKLKIIIKVEFH